MYHSPVPVGCNSWGIVDEITGKMQPDFFPTREAAEERADELNDRSERSW